MNRTQLTLDAATARRLAVEGSVEPRTLLKALRGEPVRGLAGQRAREVLERYGLLHATERPFVAVAKKYSAPTAQKATTGEEPRSAEAEQVVP
jgi:hypothetical protein